MISQLAQVFSSQGVLVQGTQYASAPPKKKNAAASDARDPNKSFAAKFEQASAKLELSKGAQAKMAADGKPLSEGDKKAVEELAKVDKQVHAHEQAHMASAGGVARGGANYEYKKGPDGKNYAVGGHVNIDASPVEGNPQATLRKAQTVQAAALAPADPSGDDRSVAAAAAQMAIQARKEINEKRSAGKSDASAQPAPSGDPAKAEASQAEALVASASEPASAGTDSDGTASAPAVSQSGGAYARSFTATGRAYSAYA